MRGTPILPVVLAVLALTAPAAGCGRSTPTELKDDAVRRGDALARQKQFGEAIAAYREAVRIDPLDGALRGKLARAYRETRQWKEATQEAIHAADLLPTDPAAQRDAVEALNNQGRFVDALHRMQPLLQHSPRDPELIILFANAKARLLTATTALFELQEALRRGEDLDLARARLRPKPVPFDDLEAEQAYRRAYEIAPGGYAARLALAGFLWMTGRYDQGAAVLKQAADDDPAHAFLSRALGLFYASRGREADAERYLRTAASSGDRDSQLALANYLVQRRRHDEALAILERIGSAVEPDHDAMVRAAEIELALGRDGAARRRLDPVLRRVPGHARALWIDAELLRRRGDAAAAAAIARAALAADPRSLDARTTLARALAAVGSAEAAFEEYVAVWRSATDDADIAKELARVAHGLGRTDVALEMARQSVRLRPADRDAAVGLARVLVDVRDFRAAGAALAPFVHDPSPPADLLALQGAIHAGRGSVELARTTYARALQRDPDSLDALAGVVALERGPERAARIRTRVDQAAARHPSDPRYLLLSARVAREAGDHAGAEATLANAVAIDPDHGESLLLLADILAGQRRTGEAVRLLERALARRPESGPLGTALAQLFEQSGRTTDARQLYEKIVGTGQDAPAASMRLALIYADEGEPLDLALELATQAHQRLSRDPAAKDALGWVYLRKGLPRNALPLLAEAVAAAPDNAMFRYHLGAAHARLGEIVKARREITRALELDPGFTKAADARALLERLK